MLLVSELEALVAYVSPSSSVTSDDHAVAAAECCTPAVAFTHAPSLARARASLPAYMVPSVVVGVDAWPRTSSGKIDRKRLPEIDVSPSGAAGEVVAPRTAVEAAARDAFAVVLGVADAASLAPMTHSSAGGARTRW